MGELTLIAGLLLVGFSVYLLASMIISANQDQQSLLWATDEEPSKSNSGFVEFSRPLVHKFSLGLAGKVNKPKYRKKVESNIKLAGLQREINVDEFIGLQILWGIIFPIVITFLNFTLEMGYSWPVIVGVGAIGWYFPNIHLNNERKERVISVITDLPFFIDLLALSTEAGLDFIGSIQRVVDKAENSVLAEEFAQVLRDIKLGGTRADALRSMSDRLEIQEITSFVTVLIDADATGASIGQVLKQQSVQMRSERFMRAEKAGAKASQTILLPLMIFILPAVFIILFGPVIIQFISGD